MELTVLHVTKRKYYTSIFVQICHEIWKIGADSQLRPCVTYDLRGADFLVLHLCSKNFCQQLLYRILSKSDEQFCR